MAFPTVRQDCRMPKLAAQNPFALLSPLIKQASGAAPFISTRNYPVQPVQNLVGNRSLQPLWGLLGAQSCTGNRPSHSHNTTTSDHSSEAMPHNTGMKTSKGTPEQDILSSHSNPQWLSIFLLTVLVFFSCATDFLSYCISRRPNGSPAS